MTSLAHADLSGLVRGELATDVVTASGEHLHTCEACRDDLLPTVLGHALLARSARTLGPDAAEPPTLGAVDAAFGADEPGRHRPALRLLGVAVALTAAAGLGAVSQAQLVGEGNQTVVEPQRSATLEAVAGGATSSVGGTVAMTEASGHTSMTISTHDLPAARDGQFYYAWLLDPETDKMLPLGQVGPSGSASFEVSDQLLAAYTAVDVSLEDDDGDPQHSPTSVLRAVYA